MVYGDTEACGRRFAEEVELSVHIFGAFLAEGDDIFFLARFHSEVENFTCGKGVADFVLRERQYAFTRVAVAHQSHAVRVVDNEFVCGARNAVQGYFVVEPTGDVEGKINIGMIALHGEGESYEFGNKLRAARVEFGMLMGLYVEVDPFEFVFGGSLKFKEGV